MIALTLAVSRRRATRLVASAALVAAVSLAGTAHAGDPARAKELFNAGAHAYSLGAFAAAARAFEDAYAEDPQPAILFSLSQARRRQFIVEPRREILQQALAGFEQYLRLVPQGGRRADAAQAVEELRTTLASLPVETPVVTPVQKAKTASLIVSSPTNAATLAIDGQAASPLPFVGELPPGLHVLVVAAPGHSTSRREVLFPEGGLATLDVPLQELPARLAVETEPGITILVDGRPSGQTPLTRPIEVPAGPHIVTLLRRGRESVAEEIDTERGEIRTLRRNLGTSGRRIASYGFAGVGAAGVITGTALAFVALGRKDTADDLLAKRDRVGLTPAELSEYSRARTDREVFRTASIITIGASAGLMAVGGFLYLFEEPAAGGVPVRFGPARKTAPAGPTKEKAVPEISFQPLVGPTWGIGTTGRF